MESSYKHRIRTWNGEFYNNIEGIIDLMPDNSLFESEAALSSRREKWDPWHALWIDLDHIANAEEWHTQYLEYLQSDADVEYFDASDDENSAIDNNNSKKQSLDEIIYRCKTTVWNTYYTKDQIKLFFDIYPALSWSLLALFTNARIDAINIGRLDDVIMLDLCNNDISDLAIKIYDERRLNDLLKQWNGSIDKNFAALTVSSNNIILLEVLYKRNPKVFLQRTVMKLCNYNTALYIVKNTQFENITPKQEAELVIGIIQSGHIVYLYLDNNIEHITLSRYFNYLIKYGIAGISRFKSLYTGEVSEIDGENVHQLKYALKSYIFDNYTIMSYLDNDNSFYPGILDDILPNMNMAIKIWQKGKITDPNEWNRLVVRLCDAGIYRDLEFCPKGLLNLIINHLNTFPDKIYDIVKQSLIPMATLWSKCGDDNIWKDVITRLSVSKRDDLLKFSTYINYSIALIKFIADNASSEISIHAKEVMEEVQGKQCFNMNGGSNISKDINNVAYLISKLYNNMKQ